MRSINRRVHNRQSLDSDGHNTAHKALRSHITTAKHHFWSLLLKSIASLTYLYTFDSYGMAFYLMYVNKGISFLFCQVWAFNTIIWSSWLFWCKLQVLPFLSYICLKLHTDTGSPLKQHSAPSNNILLISGKKKKPLKDRKKEKGALLFH